MNDQAIRLSDAERDAAAADLSEHFAQGRLTAEEHAGPVDPKVSDVLDSNPA